MPNLTTATTPDLTHRPLASLKPYARNARTHSKAQVAQIAKSIERFGFTNPVLVSDEGQIVAGHGRVEAARLLGLETVPTLALSHLSETERRAYVLADNKLAANAGWDQELLALELVRAVLADEAQDAIARVRVLYLALWILTVWAREADNLEAAYSASELVTLRAWELLAPAIAQDRSRKQTASYGLFELVQLHLAIWDELYGQKVLPHAASRHALSYAAWSQESLDINLALFKNVGRIALGGLWQAWLTTPHSSAPALLDRPAPQVEAVAIALANLIEANPTLYTPACERPGH